MKPLLLVIFLLSSMAMNAQTTSRYKAGFQYYDNRGCKITLLQWVKVCCGEKRILGDTETWRWKIKQEFAGVTASGWTDDRWIDIDTGKAFLNERTHQIVYYDSVIITPKVKHNALKRDTLIFLTH